MKTLACFFLLILLGSWAFCAPLRNAPTEVVQPDGSAYKCFMSGDEYYHRAHDANGYTIIKDLQTDWYVYAQKQGLDLVPTELVPGRDDPAARGLTPHLLPDESILVQRFQNWRGSTRDDYGRAPTIGSIENLCIFIRFAGETEFSQPLQLYNDMHNSTTGVSMRGYFQEESGGQLTVSSTFYPTATGSMVFSWQSGNTRNYFYPQSPSNPGGYPAGPPSDPDMYGYLRLHSMLVNAVNAVMAMIPPNLNIDADNNLKVDNLSFICRGNADATSAIFWPHYWVLDAYPATPLTYINYMGIPRQADDYNFSLQYQDPLYVGYGGGIDAAEISHEFSHTLGFPDLYHYTWDGVNPCGYWDLMDYCYQVPQHHLTYMKMKYGGWFAAPNPLPAAGTACTLNAVAISPFDHYVYQMPTGEQIWIEYRKAVGAYETRVPYSGLIFYRVDQAYYPWGNAGGPPDEVYVYRPYVSTSPPDGNINWAAFAWEQSLTAFNQFTDPNPFSQSMPGFIAPLNIHSIESNNGTQMNFMVGTVIPVIWNGTADNNWFNPANWNGGMVPTPADFVIIPPVGGWFPCQVQPIGIPAVCMDLRNEFMLTVMPAGMLQVGRDFISIGRFFQDGTTQVARNFTIRYWYAGSWLQSTTFLGAQLTIGGNCQFDTGTQIQMQVGQLIFANVGISPPVSSFTCDSFGAVMFDLIVNKTGNTLNYNSLIPGMAVNILGMLSVTNNSTLIMTAPHFISLSGNLSVALTGLLQVQETVVNTFNFVGPPALQTISINNTNSYLNHLSVQNNAAPMLASSLVVRGNFSIMQGTFIANNNTIAVRGNWVNNMGLGGFQKGTSRVVFNGPVSDQTITVAGMMGAPLENFYILELNKALGSLNMNTTGQMIQCDFYDWTSGLMKVTDGQFDALSLLDGYIAGNFTCNAPGVINLTDTAGMGDLGANLNIQGGTINVFCPTAGAGSVSTWGILSGSLNMSSGWLGFQNCGINIIPGGGTFSTNISGGTIRVAGDVGIHRTEFTPSGGLIWVNSPFAPANIGTMGGGWFYDLQLATPTTITTSDVQINGTLTIDPSCTLNVGHNFTIANNLFLNGSMYMLAPVTVQIGILPNVPGGAILDVRDAFVSIASPGAIPIDGTIRIENGTLDATNHTFNINFSGSIVFGFYGTGMTGRLKCANVSTAAPGNFVPTVGTLELANNQPLMVFALSFASGNHVNNLDVNIQTSVQLMTDLYVLGNLHILSGQLVMDNTGKTIYMQGNWTNDIPATGFVKGNSTVDFGSAGTASISANGGTEQFYTLSVGSGTLILMDDVAVANVLNILTSTLQVNGQTLSVTGNTTVGPNAMLDLDSGSIMETGNSRQVIIQSNGSLSSIGVVGNQATMRGQAGATWHLTANPGSNLAVKYTFFRNLRSTGVTIQNGAVVSTTDDFDNCTFRDGASGCTFLTVNNNQTLNITGISFPTSVPGGYNIAKTVNAGVVNVLSSSGSFAGPLYENDTYARVNWTGYDPNLIIQSFSVSDPDPYLADQISYTVVIKNDSPNPVQSTFKIHLFKNSATPPGWGATGDLNHTYPVLAPNATHSYSFSGIYSMTPESWTSWLLIDPEGAVQETDEYDNRDSETLTWQGLPAVEDMDIVDNGDGTARVSWTYPIWADSYNIYAGSDPYGTLSYQGSATGTYLDVSTANHFRFYLVKAVRETP